MGMLDDVTGAVLRGGAPDPNSRVDGGSGGLGDLLGGLLGGSNSATTPAGPDRTQGNGATGGLEGLLGGSGATQAGAGGGALADVLGGLLGNDGQVGGLGGVLRRFEQAGLGDKARSWVGDGPNAPVSGEQVDHALGHDTLSGMATRLGLDASVVSGLLASVLPLLIDRFTPQGQVPDQGLGDQREARRRLTDSL